MSIGPTPELLAELRRKLAYNPDTGVFTWIVSEGAKAGSEAGFVTEHGYVRIRLLGRLHMAHRLAWLYMHGDFPPNQLDHKNRVRNDNRISNLRPATRKQNNENTSLQVNNWSSAKGVSWHAGACKWVAQITHNNECRYLGLHTTIASASAAYQKAADELFTHHRDRS